MQDMVNRKWAELPIDCLVEIFIRVGLSSLVESVSVVCKSWYKATFSPLCWQSLFFPTDIPRTREEKKMLNHWAEVNGLIGLGVYSLSHEAFAKFVLSRSNGSANVVALSGFSMTQNVLDCVGEWCPKLKKLELPPYDIFQKGLVFSSVICKWKDLEALEIGGGYTMLEQIFTEISIHCKNFVSFSGVNVEFRQNEASAIANLLPNLKFIRLKDSWIEQSHLVPILKCCKKLEVLDIRDCIGFKVDDEILNLSALIPSVSFEGSQLTCDGLTELQRLLL